MVGTTAQTVETGPVPARVRWITVRGLAAAISGVVVLGVGSRLVMLASRLLHPDAVGRLTENGNRIGDVTVSGTVALLLFVGLLGGVTAGFIWVATKQWLPQRPWVVAVAAVALGGSRAVTASNRDFTILSPPLVDVVLLLGMVAAFGAVLPLVDAWLEERLPPADDRLRTVLYAVPIVLVAPLLVPIGGGFFVRDLCFCEDPPVLVGIALALAGVASVWWWVIDGRGAEEPPTGLRRFGAFATAGAVVVGAVGLVGEVTAIL